MDSLPCSGLCIRCAAGRLILDQYLRSIFKFVETSNRHDVSLIQAAYARAIAVGSQFRHRMQSRCRVADDIHKRLRPVVLDCGTRYQNDTLTCPDKQTRIDELIREQSQVRILELAAKTDGPGRAVDLVVEREKFAGSDLRQLGAIVRIDGQTMTTRDLPRTWLRSSSATLKTTVIG